MSDRVELELNEEDEAWGRGEGEPERAYQAFCTYLKLGPGRNLHAAYRAGKVAKDGQSPRQIAPPANWKRWFRDFHWKLRAAIYDRKMVAEMKERVAEEQRNLFAERLAMRARHRNRLQFLDRRIAEFESAPLVKTIIRKDDQIIIHDRVREYEEYCRERRELIARLYRVTEDAWAGAKPAVKLPRAEMVFVDENGKEKPMAGYQNSGVQGDGPS